MVKPMLNERYRFRSAAAALTLGALLAACGGEGSSEVGGGGKDVPGDTADGALLERGQQQGAEAGPPPAPKGPTGPVANLPPNEMGRIMVLEYHRTGSPEGEFVRTLANFRKDLQSLYERGYRPVTMRQVLEKNIDIPAGTTPVVFTFDDATRGQFYFRPDGSIDPNTMVGSWDAFKKQNPAWSGGGVWCILPAAAHPSNFFGETPDKETPRAQREANIRKKMEWFVANGHEICNHTLYHARLDRGTDRQVQDWIGIGEDSIKAYLPAGYDIKTFALPLGMWPKNRALAWQGSYRDGKTYTNDVVLEVSGGPNVPPWDREWNPRSVDRFIVAPGALERQLQRWEQDPSNRYVSDGDARTVSFPRSMASRLDRSKLGNLTPRELPDTPPPAAKAP
jgi:peptidoglycan/xylan/chitin deacetylase (PgdA/CDA1 family)